MIPDFEGVVRSIFDAPRIEKWDRRFLELGRQISTWSKDPSTKMGAIIVRPDNTVCSVGYNGFPKGMADTIELYENREEKYSRIIHCEVNALLFSHDRVVGYTLYTYPFASCDRCAAQMIQAGIKRFVFPKIPPHLEERWGDSVKRTKSFLTESYKEFTEY